MDKRTINPPTRKAEIFREARYKRRFDLTILVMAHIFPLVIPVWVLVWTLVPILIWLEDKGPVFYRQRRAGKNGRVFTVLKFRTMIRDADRVGPAWAIQNDSRITRVGKLLRRTALDELPEIIAIWRGDMSLVGPRALAVEEQRRLEEEIPGFRERLLVRPGLTGLAQVRDRTDDARTKLRYDMEYVGCMSLWLDVKLLGLSVVNTFLARWDKRSGKGTANGEVD